MCSATLPFTRPNGQRRVRCICPSFGCDWRFACNTIRAFIVALRSLIHFTFSIPAVPMTGRSRFERAVETKDVNHALPSKLDAAYRCCRCVESLEPEHRSNPLFDAAMILLYNIVQYLLDRTLMRRVIVPADCNSVMARCEAA